MTSQAIGAYGIVLVQDGVHGTPQIADAFAVDDTQFQHALLPAIVDVLEYHFLHLRTAEGMQV